MFERMCEQPSAEELRSYEDQITTGVSILLLKPEVSSLSPDEKEWLYDYLENYFSQEGNPICVFQVAIDRESAKDIWRADIEKYDWAEQYYEHMSSSACVAIVLNGSEAAFMLKHRIRDEMSGPIARIKAELQSEFIPDVVHGSDPTDGYHEFVKFADMYCKTHFS